MLALVALLQAAAATPAPPTAAPDIELNINVRAKSVEIERKGEAKLEVRGGDRSLVDVQVQPKTEGRTSLRNVEVRVKAQASVTEGAKVEAEAETGTPQ